MNRMFIIVYALLCFPSPNIEGAEAAAVHAFSIPRTQVIDIEDTHSHRNYQLYIKIPSGYDNTENSGKLFPVVYLTDASYIFPVVEGLTRVAMHNGVMLNAIIVGISCEVGVNPLDSLVRDYTPTINKEFKRKTGEANVHLRFIKEDVFSYVERRFRADPHNRTYIGYSLGGLLGAYALLTQPEMFNNYVLVSPSLWYDKKYIFQLESSGKYIKPKSKTRVFISAGEFETPEYVNIQDNLVADAREFTRRVQHWNNDNVQIRLHIVKGAVHEIAFPEPIVKALYWLLHPSNL